MDEIIRLLVSMGASKVGYVKDVDDDEGVLKFTFQGKEAKILAEWYNDGTAGLNGSVTLPD